MKNFPSFLLPLHLITLPSVQHRVLLVSDNVAWPEPPPPVNRLTIFKISDHFCTCLFPPLNSSIRTMTLAHARTVVPSPPHNPLALNTIRPNSFSYYIRAPDVTMVGTALVHTVTHACPCPSLPKLCASESFAHFFPLSLVALACLSPHLHLLPTPLNLFLDPRFSSTPGTMHTLFKLSCSITANATYPTGAFNTCNPGRPPR